MNMAIRRTTLKHGFGDLVNACYAVPQNPLIRGLAGLCGMGDTGNSYTESYMWPQKGVRSNTIQLKNTIQSVQSVTVNGVPQTVVSYSNPPSTPAGPPDYLWYYDPGTTQIAPTYSPPLNAQVVVNYTGQLPSAVTPIPQPSQIYKPAIQPSATTGQPPNIVAAANASPTAIAAGQQWGSVPLNPSKLMKPLPQIVTHNPLPDVTPMCTDTFAQWVSQNAILAGAALVVAFFAVSGKGKG